MRANPAVCVEWDDVTRFDLWASAVAFGRHEELPPPPRNVEGGIPGRSNDRADLTEEEREWLRATDLLRRHITWWQPGGAAFAARNHHDPAEPFRALYYRIRVDQMTGHRATPDSLPAPSPPRVAAGRFRRAVRRLAAAFSWRSEPSE